MTEENAGQTETQLPLFVYGTLRAGRSNHHYLAGRFERCLAAVLPGFAWTQTFEPLMIGRRAGGQVEGELYFFPAESYRDTLERCDELEELTPGTTLGLYRRLAVTVETPAGPFQAWVYAEPGTMES